MDDPLAHAEDVADIIVKLFQNYDGDHPEEPGDEAILLMRHMGRAELMAMVLHLAGRLDD